MIAGPVIVLVLLGMQQLVDDEGELLRHGLTDLGTGIFGGEIPGQVDEPLQELLVAASVEEPLGLHAVQLLPGIVDEGAELRLLRGGHDPVEEEVDLLPDHAGAVVDDVLESLVFPVGVTEEVLRPLGQVQDRLQIDDLRKSRPPVGKNPGQQLQIFLPGLFVRLSACPHNPLLLSVPLKASGRSPVPLVSVRSPAV